MCRWVSNIEKRGRGAPFIAANNKARGVYIGVTETICGNGPSYFADLAFASASFLNNLRTGSRTNSTTVRSNYCKPSENLFSYFNVFPNPTSSNSLIRYKTTQDSKNSLTIIDMLGKEIDKIYSEHFQKEGIYDVNYGFDKLSQGIFFVKLQTDIDVFTQKVLIIK